MRKLLPFTLVPMSFALMACGAADDGTSDDVAQNNDPEATPPVDEPEESVAELAPGIENPHGYPGCGDDPSNQPSPCIDYKGAVRCALNTGYSGDELALCDMNPEDGMLLHFGPSDYDDPDAVAPFLLGPGEEQEFCMYLKTPNTEARYMNAYHGRMRPNSHHLIVTMPEDREPSEAPFECGPQVLNRWFFGSQDPQIDVQNGGEGEPAGPGDPDFRLGQLIPANQTLLFDFHNLNVTEETELREAWASFSFVEESEIETTLDMLAFYQLDITVPPLSEATTPRKTCIAPDDRYIGLMTGHAHEWMSRFSVWHETTDGESNLVYETYDWAEPGNAVYRDAVQNPTLPIEGGNVWGATSGYLHVKKGEAISFECHYRNDQNIPIHLGDTAGDEMCNVFGMYYPSDGNTWNCF